MAKEAKSACVIFVLKFSLKTRLISSRTDHYGRGNDGDALEVGDARRCRFFGGGSRKRAFQLPASLGIERERQTGAHAHYRTRTAVSEHGREYFRSLISLERFFFVRFILAVLAISVDFPVQSKSTFAGYEQIDYHEQQRFVLHCRSFW